MALAVSWFLLFTPSQPKNVEAQPNEFQEVASYEYGTWVPELPVRLIIPSIDVDAPVQYVGLDASGTGEMEVPSNFTDVGWYKHGVRPGMRGSAVIAGHLNGREVAEAVFYDLHTLEVGDEVVIMSAERVEDIFFVVKVETYDYNEATEDVFVSTDGKARLNLITCGGKWLPNEKVYDKRTVVFTELLTDVE
jgi:LPXTG-site transpeptidase (sortase) family protein